MESYWSHQSGNKSEVWSDTEDINPLTPELNSSEQRCLMKYFTGDFSS
jgi:hypothetical protein